MSFQGAGQYDIRTFLNPEYNINNWGGTMEPGASVRLHPRNPSSPNALWQVSPVSGSGDNTLYLIINVLTGYFITTESDNAIVSTPQISPANQNAHWKIVQAPNGGGSIFNIISVVPGRGLLTVQDGAVQRGTPIIASMDGRPDSQKWYFTLQQ